MTTEQLLARREHIVMSLEQIRTRRAQLNAIVQENIIRSDERRERLRLLRERDLSDFLVVSVKPIKENKKYNPCGKDCSICLEEVKANGIETDCNHHFHIDCINSWRNIGKNSCPNCRHNI